MAFDTLLCPFIGMTGDGYAMLMNPNEGKTAVHGCHCLGDMALHVCEAPAKLCLEVCVNFAFSLSQLVLARGLGTPLKSEPF